MIKPSTDHSHFGRRLTPGYLSIRVFVICLLFSALGFSARAQSVSWTDNFISGQAPSVAQCQNWTNFLDQLGQKSFVSVTISGTFDETGKTITDPVAATQLAQLLSSRTTGTIYTGDHYWTVGTCGLGACGSLSITLSVDGNTVQCDCSDTYAIKAHSQTSDWGGINTATCDAPSQTMRLVFNSGVSVSANGSTALCPGGNVVLTANAQTCAAPYTYVWNNGATTQSITVTEAGSYSVTVTGADGCSGTSSAIEVTVSQVTVDAGVDAIFCEEPVQLFATGSSGGPATAVVKSCLFDSPGGAGNCTFTNDLCADGAEFFTNQSFSATTTALNPLEIRFHMYYSPFTEITTFTFRLNGSDIGSFQDNDPTGTCTPAPFGQYPRTVTFNESQFKQYWDNAGSNTLSVQVVAGGMGVYLGGISAEVVTSNEFYAWSPAAGLSDASIRNPLASPDVTTVYTVVYTAADGCTATDQVEVSVNCDMAPIAVCKPVTVSANENCQANVVATAFDGGSASTTGGQLSFSVSPAGPYPMGETSVTVTVSDSNGESSTCTTVVTVIDTTPPVITAPSDVVVANDAGVCSATIVLVAPEGADNCGVQAVTHDQTDDIFPAGETLVTWTMTDIHGNVQTATQKVIVSNDAPVVNSVTASPSMVEVNSPVTLSVTYTDNNVKNASIDWGDLGAPENIESPLNSFNVTHAYSHSGTYTVEITLTDHCDAMTAYLYESVVIYENRGGSVKGNGWFYSMPGYYVKDTRASGKAQFGFDAEYRDGANAPAGSATFKFRAGRLQFTSTEYEMLHIDGQSAFLTGIGKVNGQEGYGILIAMFDGNMSTADLLAAKLQEREMRGNAGKKSDRIRVMIWDSAGEVIYDTQSGDSEDAGAATYLGGGSITIDDGSQTLSEGAGVFADYGPGENSAAVYPNPFHDWMSVQFNSASSENISIRLINFAGEVLHSAQYPVSEDGSYSFEVPEGKNGPGIYLLIIKQGRKVQYVRVVRE